MGQEIFSILLVDDEKNERKGIEKLIQKNGYPLEIFQAENGIEALKIFKNRKIDILLTDIKMPFMDGIKLMKEIHKGGVRSVLFTVHMGNSNMHRMQLYWE